MLINLFSLPSLLGLILLGLILPFLWQKKRSAKYLVIFSLFWFYLLMVASLTLLPIRLPLVGEARLPVWEILSRVNLEPFKFLRQPRISFSMRVDLIGNILLTLPFGLLLPAILPLKARHFLWLAVGIGFGIELAQLILNIIAGGNFRVVDINDVLMNTIGALIGFGVYGLVSWLRHRK